jgi:hypothetical protein
VKKFTIEVAAKYASRRTKRSSRLCQGGKQQATRKNPHVIDVGLEQDTQRNYRCFMLMAICTTATFAI